MNARAWVGVVVMSVAAFDVGCETAGTRSGVDGAVVAPVVDAAAIPKISPPPPTSLPDSGAAASDAVTGNGPSETDPDLHGEDAEKNPRSESVTLKLAITPVARGTVHWGRKKLADLQAGKMTVEIQRPRDSGPLDLLIRADGFLPHHVRLFTDRNDKLSVRLVRGEDAHSLFGYRKGPVPPAPQ